MTKMNFLLSLCVTEKKVYVHLTITRYKREPAGWR